MNDTLRRNPARLGLGARLRLGARLGLMARPGLGARLGIIAVILTGEALLRSYLIQQTTVAAEVGLAVLVHDIQHWLFRFVIAYAVACFLLFSLARGGSFTGIGARHADVPLRPLWFGVHLLCLLPFELLSTRLYAAAEPAQFVPLAVGWHAAALTAWVTLIAAFAPLRIWARVCARYRALFLYALAPAAGTVLAIEASQALWRKAASASFVLSAALLRPFIPELHLDFATLTISTNHFAVLITDQCSGLEGVGLMLVFCVGWLWFLRREYYFPAALLIIPAALAFVFLLNSVRIAALVLIGNAGHPEIAMFGFHSQAGWIAFNTAAFIVALIAKRSPWLNRTAQKTTAGMAVDNPTAPYLMPLLAILACGMLARALSAGFDWLYALRLVGGAAMLWVYRRPLRTLAWGFSWRGILLGMAVCGLWIGFDHEYDPATAMPDALGAASTPVRDAWILCRILATVVTVPIAEELAYRGFLLRRIASADFEQAFARAGWPALIASSVIFGLTHGRFWAPGILAGLGFGWLAMRTGKIGEAVMAHAVANGGIAAYVLFFDRWALW